jgi:hypothetical protein
LEVVVVAVDFRSRLFRVGVRGHETTNLCGVGVGVDGYCYWRGESFEKDSCDEQPSLSFSAIDAVVRLATESGVLVVVGVY